jgi:hypothetical protein
LLWLDLGDPSALAVAHLVFAVGLLPLIFGAITHFVPVLTRSGRAHRAVLRAPLLLQVAGVAAVLHFYGAAGVSVLHGAAGGSLLVALAFSVWLIVRAHRTLGNPHPGWRWYLAAIGLLSCALASVPAMVRWPDAHVQLRLFHLHLNTLGFIGLAAIGTLQVLLPTVLSGPDAEAAWRLRRDLCLFVGGVLAVALGAALWLPLALGGAAALLSISWRLGLAWLRRYGLRAIADDGAAVALSVALLGFVLLIVLGVLHAFRIVGGRDAVPAFVAAFLLPLVTGALSQLLPVWRRPGPHTPARARMRAALVAGGRLRSLLFFGGGVALAFGNPEGLWLVAGGLASFAIGLLRSLLAGACSSKIVK